MASPGSRTRRLFSGGLAAVQVGDKWRFITHKGKENFEREFTKVHDFSEDLAPVQEQELTFSIKAKAVANGDAKRKSAN